MYYLFVHLAWIYSKFKDVAPALPAFDTASAATTTVQPLKDDTPKVAEVPVAAMPSEDKVTKRRRRKKTTVGTNLGSSTITLATEDDDGDADSKTVLKRSVLLFAQ